MSGTQSAWLLSTAIGLSVILFFYGYILRRSAAKVALAMMESVVKNKKAMVNLPSGTITEQLLRLGKKYALMAERYPDLIDFLLPVDIEQRLAWAGNPSRLQGKDFVGMQLVFMALMAVIGVYMGWMFVFGFSWMTFSLGFLLLPLGAPLALKWLDQQANRRQREITRALPDAIDLVTTSVVAGLDIDRAIERTVEHLDGVLSEELRRFLNELHFGTPRGDAYRNLMWRNRSEEMQNIVGALAQGQHLGVPVSQTLSEQAEAMRERRLQRAKEEGSKIPTNITLIMMIFILPSVFVMFLVVFGYSVVRDMMPMLQTGM